MRFIRTFFWIIVALALIVLALANRQVVELRVLPADLAILFGGTGSISVPLFIVILAGVALGLIIGFLWEWLRESKIRRDLRGKDREVIGLKREVAKLRSDSTDEKAEILALLDKA